jgi:hypothetical protein
LNGGATLFFKTLTRVSLPRISSPFLIAPMRRLMSQALRKLTSNIKKTNTMVIFINQLRMKIGVMFGNPETTAGGNALK